MVAPKDSKFSKPSKIREPKFLVVIGKKGIGKTWETINLIEDYASGDSYPARKVLIVDTNNEFSQYKAIDVRDVAAFAAHPKVEIRRVQPFVYDPELKAHRKMNLDELAKALQYCLENFWGGMILIEDITKYISDNMPSDLIGSLCTQRHIDVDVICHFQGIGKAGNPKIKANMNTLRFHKCLESVERHKNKFDEYTEILKIAEMLVNKRFDEGTKRLREMEEKKITRESKAYKAVENEFIRFCVYVNFDESKITGRFTREEFYQAIESFISENTKESIQPLLNRKDKTGKKVYTYEQAYKIVESGLITQYYGNAD